MNYADMHTGNSLGRISSCAEESLHVRTLACTHARTCDRALAYPDVFCHQRVQHLRTMNLAHNAVARLGCQAIGSLIYISSLAAAHSCNDPLYVQWTSAPLTNAVSSNRLWLPAQFRGTWLGGKWPRDIGLRCLALRMPPFACGTVKCK